MMRPARVATSYDTNLVVTIKQFLLGERHEHLHETLFQYVYDHDLLPPLKAAEDLLLHTSALMAGTQPAGSLRIRQAGKTGKDIGSLTTVSGKMDRGGERWIRFSSNNYS